MGPNTHYPVYAPPQTAASTSTGSGLETFGPLPRTAEADSAFGHDLGVKVMLTLLSESVKWRHLPQAAQLCRGNVEKGKRDALISKSLQEVMYLKMLDKMTEMFLLHG